MLLNDRVNFIGDFSIKAFKKDGTIEEYREKNLIMDLARTNMAQLIGGVTTVTNNGDPINKFVLGTLGHHGTNVLDYVKVGENRVVGDDSTVFNSTRTSLYSEETGSGAYNYNIPFDVTGDEDVTVNVDGEMFLADVSQWTDTAVQNTIQRVVSERTVTYTITIPTSNANSLPEDPTIAYTEAALYAGDEIFSMKCFPARVKEDTVKLVITWSIIF